MSTYSHYKAKGRRFEDVIHSVLGAMSFYIVPFAIALFSIVALTFWDSHYQAMPDNSLRLRVIQTDATLTPGDALRHLAEVPPVHRYETRLSEDSVWFAFQVFAEAGAQSVIEFPSRHATDMACWDANTLEPIGKASKTRAEGGLYAVKAGFALKVQPQVVSAMCRARFAGPARLTAQQWTPQQLAISAEQYHRKSGLLDGGLIVLAMFVLMIAFINREKLYLLFAAWLCLNLRVGALSAGWDVQWLGQHVPGEWLLSMRAITIAFYSLVMLELYLTLFREDIPGTRFAIPLKITHWMCIPLLIAAVTLPFGFYLPVMWGMASAGLMVMVLSLLSILAKTRSKVAFWLVISYGVTFLSSLSEVIAAALGMHDFLGVINSVTAALASSLLAALAIAERIRQEHAQRLEAQAELKHTYEVMPIGLFTLDSNGQLLSANPAFSQMLGAGKDALSGEGWMRHFQMGTWTALHELVHRNNDAELEA